MSASAIADRNRQSAIHHATIIHQQKHVQAAILESLEELIDFPSPSNPSPAASSPSPSDLASFRKHVAPFQVSDYDALIEERNAAKKCGYVFCPNPYETDRRQSQFRILWGNSRGQPLRVVQSNQVPRWCSVDCARRAMYIKVQLSEVPAWERAGGLGNKVDVLKEADEEALAAKMSQMTLGQGEEARLRRAMEQLAIERGDDPSTAHVAKVVVKENGNHKTGSLEPSAEPPQGGRQNYLKIEGYEPVIKGGDGQTLTSELDSDWKLS